ncbi:MAG: MATE family efflux transporter [Lachnospiraceae bacterium]|nr:MATE family efflux transporter [Lachnospiraceae bacterium]
MFHEPPKQYLFSGKDLRKLIIPLLIEQFLSVLVGFCDSIMAAFAGEAAISGVSLVDVVFVLIINIFTALGSGGAVVAGQYLGAKRDEDGRHTVNQLILFTALSGIAVAALVFILRPFLLDSVFGQITADTREAANTYLLITAPSIPFIALFGSGAALYRAEGNAREPMLVSLGMNLLNITGNAIMVYVLRMGVVGVAVPTLLSRMFAGIVMMLLLRDPSNRLCYAQPFRWHIEGALLKKILYIAIPNSVENSVFQLGKILLLSVVSTLGTAAISANAVSNTIVNLQSLPGIAMQSALLAVTAQCIGAGDYEQVDYYLKRIIKMTYLYMGITCVLSVVCIDQILSVYNISPEAAHSVKVIIIFIAAAKIIWPLAFVFPNVLRAANDVRFCMLVSAISMWTLRIGGAIFAVKVLHMGVEATWFAMPLDWIARLTFFIRRYLSGKWKVYASRNTDL